ncbi:MAG: hypothetical protein JO023_19625 [Chloroflexi bacterium]|nr:hypothetical protein [Chloroflexota bacterium]
MTSRPTSRVRGLASGAARTGSAARGVVSLLVGWLAAPAAAGVSGDTTDTHGVLGGTRAAQAEPL